jgi:glyoxylase-like metal-dependent hydrolase (beta-lactamase superfamily II)
MISGEKDMLLIDPQFSLSEAHRLAAEILESKKNLAVIYVTHPHPDHLFGLAVLKQAFPQPKIFALPATVNAAKTGWPARQCTSPTGMSTSANPKTPLRCARTC